MEYKVALCDDDEKIASKIMEAFNNELQCVCSISSDTRIVFITSHEELVFDTLNIHHSTLSERNIMKQV